MRKADMGDRHEIFSRTTSSLTCFPSHVTLGDQCFEQFWVSSGEPLTESLAEIFANVSGNVDTDLVNKCGNTNL